METQADQAEEMKEQIKKNIEERETGLGGASRPDSYQMIVKPTHREIETFQVRATCPA
jgi:hypothetical protein